MSLTRKRFLSVRLVLEGMLTRAFHSRAKARPTAPSALVLAMVIFVGCQSRKTVPNESSKLDASVAIRPTLSGSPANGICDRICTASRPLRCRNSNECKSSCTSLLASPVCGNEIARFLSCLVAQPVDRWECDSEGFAAIRDPFCDVQQGETARCFKGHSR